MAQEASCAALGGGESFAGGEVGDGRRHVGRPGPQPDHGDEEQRRVAEGAAAVLGGEEGEEGEARGPGAIESGDAVFPARGLVHAVADEGDEQRGRAADGEHGAPAVVRADRVVDDGGEKGAEVVAGVHPGGALFAARFGPLLGDEDAADGPLAADADARQEAECGELPDRHGGASEKREDGVAKDGEDEGADAAEAICQRSPEEGEAPADQEDGEEHAAVEADVGLGGGESGAGQEIAQRGHQDQGIDEGIHAVERPSGPCGPEAADLVGGQRLGGGAGHSKQGSRLGEKRFGYSQALVRLATYSLGQPKPSTFTPSLRNASIASIRLWALNVMT